MTGADPGRSPALASYLARLDSALAGLADEERREILLETRSHVVERSLRPPTRPVEEILAELGPPEQYARQFLPDPGTPADGTEPSLGGPAGVLQGIARLASGGWGYLPLLLVVAVAYSIAVLAVLLAVSKLLDPDATGFFVHHAEDGRSSARLVVGDPHAEGRDVTGPWLVPIALGVAIGAHVLVSSLLRRVVRAGPTASGQS